MNDKCCRLREHVQLVNFKKQSLFASLFAFKKMANFCVFLWVELMSKLAKIAFVHEKCTKSSNCILSSFSLYRPNLGETLKR